MPISAARQILSLPEGRKRTALVADLREREGCSPQHTYRKIFMATGERLKTKAGKPRRTRSEAGSHHTRPEYQQALDYKREHPKAGGAEIRQACGLAVSVSRVNAWLCEGRNIH